MITNQDVVRMVSALTALGNRTLPTINSDLRVAKLLRLLKPIADDLEVARTKRIAEAQKAIDQTQDEQARLSINSEFVAGMTQLFSQPAEVILPPEDKRLSEVDLPKDMAGEDGSKNRNALGSLIADLGELYIFSE